MLAPNKSRWVCLQCRKHGKDKSELHNQCDGVVILVTESDFKADKHGRAVDVVAAPYGCFRGDDS